MDEILKILAQHLNISEDTARKGLGAVMVFLKDHLPAGVAGQLQQALPGSDGLASHFEENKDPESSGGLLGMVSGLAGKVLGGQAGEASKLTALLGQAGLSMDQITKFLPKALELLKDRVPPEVFEKVVGLVPGLGEAPAKV